MTKNKKLKDRTKSEQTMKNNEQNKIKNTSNKCILFVVVVVAVAVAVAVAVVVVVVVVVFVFVFISWVSRQWENLHLVFIFYLRQCFLSFSYFLIF